MEASLCTENLSNSHNSENIIFSIKNNDILGLTSYTSNCSLSLCS